MAQFFDNVLGFFESIWNIISHTVKSLGIAINFFGDIIPTFQVLLSLLPAVLGGACLAVLLIMIVKFILGR